MIHRQLFYIWTLHVTVVIKDECGIYTFVLTNGIAANTLNILYSGKLSREKTFENFAILWLFAKVFSAKFGGVVSFGAAQRAIRESFSAKIISFTNSQKFSPSKASRYTVVQYSVS